MTSKAIVNNMIKRREILRRGMAGLGIAGIGASMLKPSAFTSVAEAAALAEANGKILVILELSGGNDGLNTVVPYGDDAYYRHRPEIGFIEIIHPDNFTLRFIKRCFVKGHIHLQNFRRAEQTVGVLF